MLHAELPARGGVKAEELLGGALAGHEPIVRFQDDQRKPVDGAGVTVKEVFSAPSISTLSKNGT